MGNQMVAKEVEVDSVFGASHFSASQKNALEGARMRQVKSLNRNVEGAGCGRGRILIRIFIPGAR